MINNKVIKGGTKIIKENKTEVEKNQEGGKNNVQGKIKLMKRKWEGQTNAFATQYSVEYSGDYDTDCGTSTPYIITKQL